MIPSGILNGMSTEKAAVRAQPRQSRKYRRSRAGEHGWLTHRRDHARPGRPHVFTRAEEGKAL